MLQTEIPEEGEINLGTVSAPKSLRERFLATTLMIAASIPALFSLSGCVESDQDLLSRSVQTTSIELANNPSDFLDMTVSINGENLKATQAINKMFPVTERQYVYGPHFDAFEMEMDIGWHWESVKIGEEARQVGSFYEFAGQPEMRFRAMGINPTPGCDTIVGKVLYYTDSDSCFVDVSRFIDSVTLQE